MVFEIGAAIACRRKRHVTPGGHTVVVPTKGSRVSAISRGVAVLYALDRSP